MENGVKQRVREVINANAESAYAFSKEIGVKQTTVSDYLNNGKTPSWAVIRGIIEEYSDISLEWLLRGKGTMYISDIPADGDSEQVLDLKAELMRKEGEVEGLRQTIAELTAAMAKREAQLDKLINILHEERQPSPSLSIVAEEPTYTNSNNLK